MSGRRWGALLLALAFVLPVQAQQRPQDLSPAQTQRITLPSDAAQHLQNRQEESRERTWPRRHLTLELIESESGRMALERYRELRDRPGLLEAPVRLMEASVGDTTSFYVRNVSESEGGTPVFDNIPFRLERLAESLTPAGRVEIWVQESELQPDRVNQTILDQIHRGLVEQTSSSSLDSSRGVVELVREIFGEQPRADGTGTLKILIADIDDGWTEDGDDPFIAGFFDPFHLLPTSEFEKSNQADMLFVNSRPGIYRPSVGQTGTALHTMAHELQHLIHATYGELSVFQNEGQSELAELLTGFSARSMSFLNSRSEVSGDVTGLQRWFYRFRTQQRSTVLYDYQRAQLLHAWLEEIVGPEAAGSLTRSTTTLDEAYEGVLEGTGYALSDLLNSFYLAAYGVQPDDTPNRPFRRPQLSQLAVYSPGVVYDATVQPWVRNRRETLYYGGALYTQWFGIRELSLQVDLTSGVEHTLISRRVGEDRYVIHPSAQGEWVLEEEGQIYEEVILISVNSRPLRQRPERDESRTFLYSGQWTPSNLMAERLTYHREAEGFVPIPEDPLFALATRLSPKMDGALRHIRFTVNTRESALAGDGTFRVHLRETRPSSSDPTIRIPGPSIASRTVELEDLTIGDNFIGVDASEWQVQGDQDYFVSLEVEENRGGLYLELLLDAGLCNRQQNADCPDPNDPRYDPPRTFAGLSFSHGQVQWGTYTNRNNWVMSATMVGESDSPLPDFPEPPLAEDVRLLQNFPNPFSGRTTIEFSLPERVEIRLTVHDLLGREVRMLSDGSLPAGVHRIPFDGHGLASGIYFYRLALPDAVKTRRMTLVQ